MTNFSPHFAALVVHIQLNGPRDIHLRNEMSVPFLFKLANYLST